VKQKITRGRLTAAQEIKNNDELKNKSQKAMTTMRKKLFSPPNT
jgi:hypothetical protein